MIAEEDEPEGAGEGGFLAGWLNGELVAVSTEESDLLDGLGGLIDLDGVGGVDKYDGAIDDLSGGVDKCSKSFKGEFDCACVSY